MRRHDHTIDTPPRREINKKKDICFITKREKTLMVVEVEEPLWTRGITRMKEQVRTQPCEGKRKLEYRNPTYLKLSVCL